MTHQPCNCVADFNLKLRDHNTRIVETIGIPRDGRAMFTRPTITTEKIESRKRGRAAIAVPGFCPFCGNRYEPAPAKPSIYNRLFDANVRMECMWPFPVSPAPEKLADVFEYADDEQDFPEPLRDLVRSLDDRSREELYSGDSVDFQEAFSDLCGDAYRKGVHGWLGIAANPIPKPSVGGGVSFSWGYYRTKLLFAPTAEQLLENAAEWGEAKFAAAHAAAESGEA